MGLKSILERIQQELQKKEIVREEVQRDMRKATRLSKQAILFIHQERLQDAESRLVEASRLLNKLREASTNYPELFYSGLAGAAFEEYAEAQVLLSLVQKGNFIDNEGIGVPSTFYVLGLGDVIGELRRRTLDMIRDGKMESAERCLEWMEIIYSEITAMDEAYLIVSGLRRKCDIARRVIESTRGDLTIESRRNSLERSILKLDEAMRQKKKEKTNQPDENNKIGA